MAGFPVVHFVGLSKLESASATAPGILDDILSCLGKVGFSKEQLSQYLVGFGADGVNVTMGSLVD